MISATTDVEVDHIPAMPPRRDGTVGQMTVIDDVPAPDTEATKAFGSRVMGIVNDSAIGLLLSIGHQTGLFDAMATLPGATSSEIASAAGLNERYVREWLGGMVSADIVEYEPQSKTYTVPAHHLPALTRAGGLDNVARMTQHIAQLGEVEQDIIGCFRNGGGLDYSRFPRFHALRAEEVREIFDNAVVDKILPLADDLPARLRAGIDIADFGCGSGHAINVLAKTFPESRCTGYDFSTEALRTGQAEAAELGLSNVTFEAQDLAQLDIAEAFDAILVFDAIHDQAQPGQGAGQHPSGPSARRGAPDGGRQGIEQPRGQPGHPMGFLAVHRLDDALHDGVIVRRRRGTRYRVGRATRSIDARRCRLHRGAGGRHRRRPVQQLLRRAQVS